MPTLRRNPPTSAPPGKPGGFTLMEILVAMAVLSITLLTIYQGFAATLQVNTASAGLWKAMVFAHNELARMERESAPPVGVLQGEYRDDHPMAGYTWLREVSDKEPIPGVRVRRVVFELRWDAAGAPQSYRAEVYVPPF